MTDSPLVGPADSDPTSGRPPGDSSASAPEREYPPAEQSLQAARKLLGPTTGKLKVIRRYVSVGIPTWQVRGELRAKGGPDYEIEIEGDTLEEVSFALVETLQTLGFEVGGQD